MAIRSRHLLLGLVAGGLLSASAVAQDGQPPAPPAEEPAAAPAVAPPADAVGIIRVSDCPPGELGHHHGSQYTGDRRCLPPYYGWAQPGRLEIDRTGVTYHKYLPDAWTGAPAVAQRRLPMVGMPTDTTQLGFYYQQVPHWQAYNGMVPPVPRPSDWHLHYVDGMPCPVSTAARQTILGAPQPVPQQPMNQQPPVPTPPTSLELERSAGTPELIPVPR